MARDPVTGKVELQSTSETSMLCEQYESTRVQLGDLSTWPTASALIVAPVLHEAVLTPESHKRAVAGLSGIYRYGPDVALEWALKDGWRDRRFLTSASRALLTLDGPGPIRIGRADWVYANRRVQDATGTSSAADAWAALTAQASAWWSAHLPTLLWTHCTNVVPLQPLDRESWARLHSGLPLLMEDPELPRLSEVQRRYFDCNLQSKDEEVIRQIRRILLKKALLHKSRSDFVRECLKDLNDQIPRAVAAGRHQVLLLGHVMDLLINGGVKGQLAISSLVNYVGQTLLRVFRAILATPIGDLGPWNLAPAFREVLVSTTPKQRGKVHACLSALIDYLGWLGVPRFRLDDEGLLVDSLPRAQVVWTHEIVRAIEALLPLAGKGSRCAQQAVVVLALIDYFMVRIEEVLSIRLGDLRRTDLGYALLLYPRTSDGRIKADAVRRPIDILGELVLRELHRWMEIREREGSTPDKTPRHFLFGHARHGEHRFDHPGTYELVEWALKVGSGRRNASSHDSRHKVGSEEGVEACMPHALLTDINPVDRISAGAGQGVTHSYRETYFNTYESPLRAHAERALTGYVDRTQPSPPWLPDVSDGIGLDREEAWECAKAPAGEESRRGFEDVLAAIKDLAAGIGATSVAIRAKVDAADVPEILSTVAQALDRVKPAPERLAGVGSNESVQSQTLRDFLPVISSIDNKSKFAPVRHWIASAEEDENVKRILERVIWTWKQCVKDWHFSLDELPQARPTYLMLDAAKVPRSVMLISHALELDRVPREVRDLRWHMKRDAAVRRGRPRLRLHICSCDATDEGARDAAISMKGLYVLLAAAEAWLAIHAKRETVRA